MTANKSDDDWPQHPDGPTARVQLFVAGDAPSSRRARRTVETLLFGEGHDYAVDFEIVDVLREPDRALESRLLATPTLIIQNQGRTSRYVGDTYERHDLLDALDGSQAGSSEPESS